MEILERPLPGLLVLRPKMHRDHRGFFAETWRDSWAQVIGLSQPFVQDNHARSEAPGVLRGLHFQRPPHAQDKLVWVTRGAVFDVAVDLRKGSPAYGKAYGLVLSEENALRFFVPQGFAHGYMTLEPGTEFNYKVSAYYAPEAEGGVFYDDPALGLNWPPLAPELSDKDKKLPLLSSLESPFEYRNKQ